MTSNFEKTRFPRVRGKCPMGCGEMLFLGEGGYVTCSWHDCPDPDAASRLLKFAEGFEALRSGIRSELQRADDAMSGLGGGHAC